MASLHLDETADCLGNNHVEKLILPDFQEVEVSSKNSSDNYDGDDEFGEPEIQPRVGNEYQAELPPLEELQTNLPENFVIGLPIPLTWTRDVKHDVLGSCGSSTANSDFMHVDSAEICLGEIETNLEKILKFGSSLIPGLVDEKWSAIEKDSFLLGLYIFEKNFVEVRRFIGTKQMGSLLSFYYGMFYCSQEYRRWSQCRKMKSKKCIYGQRIFTGLRQQELLSRVLPKVSAECRNALLEVSKTFVDEKMSLSDYVSTLKAMVGMAALVEAVGIGRGKQDLTGMVLEPSKTSTVIPVRPEIPTGKACSSLTTEEIVKFLSGNYRLSKARSNDLFWEAVWPRLLARGWHSEQPRSKQCLVFLIPGIKKFSRSKLVKGNHYFDSVTDILSKVAQEPGLIELEEDGDDKKTGTDDGNLPTRQRHCYLQPKRVFKFTVVDTSLSDGKIRELRTLPSEISNVFIARSLVEDSDEDTSEDDINDVSVTGNLSLKKVKFYEKQLPGKKVSKGTNQSRKVSKSHRNKKRGNAVDEAGPIVKQRQILSEKGSVGLGNGVPSFCTMARDVAHVSLCTDKLSSTSSSRGSPSGSNESLQTMIDLNLPRISSGSENGVLKLDNSQSQKAGQQSSEQPQSNPNPLRHSTRNRPPTSRALEALADGYLTVNRKRKGKDLDAASRASQRAHPNESINSSVCSRIEEADNGTSTNTSAFIGSLGPSQANEESVSGP